MEGYTRLMWFIIIISFAVQIIPMSQFILILMIYYGYMADDRKWDSVCEIFENRERESCYAYNLKYTLFFLIFNIPALEVLYFHFFPDLIDLFWMTITVLVISYITGIIIICGILVGSIYWKIHKEIKSKKSALRNFYLKIEVNDFQNLYDNLKKIQLDANDMLRRMQDLNLSLNTGLLYRF